MKNEKRSRENYDKNGPLDRTRGVISTISYLGWNTPEAKTDSEW